VKIVKMKDSSYNKERIELMRPNKFAQQKTAALLGNHYSGRTIYGDDCCHRVKDRKKEDAKKSANEAWTSLARGIWLVLTYSVLILIFLK
jgi:hypothetical protein